MSEVTIDSISIEVDSSAAFATKNLDKLSKALADLRSNAKLTTTVNNLTRLKSALDEIKSTANAAQTLRDVSSGLRKMAQVDIGGLRKNINALNRLPAALGGLQALNLGQSASHIGALAQALRPLESIGKSNLGTIVSNLKKIPDIANSLDTQIIAEFGMKIQQLTKAMTPLAVQMDSIARGFDALPSDINKAVTALDTYNKAQSQATQKSKTFSNVLSNLKAGWLAYGYVWKQVADILGAAMDSFNDRYENMNLFSVAMGEYADDAYAYAQRVSDALGVNMSDWARYQGVFMQLGTGFGIVTDKAYSMSRGLTELTYDISSFFNLPVEEAYNKVASGISGELEPLRRLGYALDEATLQQVAYQHGITKSMQTMTQAEKAQIRYVAIVEQSGNAIGDMARTIDSPANAIRIFKSQIASLAQTFGMLVSIIVSKFVPVVQAIVIVVTKAVNAISVLLTGKSLKTWDMSAFNVANSYGAAADAADGVAGSTKKAADSAKKLKQYTMGWDELNVIDTDTAVGSAGTGGGAGGAGGSDLGLDLDSIWTEDMLKGINTEAQEIASALERILPTALGIGTAFGLWKLGGGIYKSVTALNEAVSAFAASQGVATTAGTLKTLGSAALTAAGAVLYFSGAWDSVLNGISWKSFAEQIGGVGLAWLGVDMIFKNSKFGIAAKSVMLLAAAVDLLYQAFREIAVGRASAATVVQAIAGIGLAAAGVALKFGPIPGIVTAAVGAIALAAAEIYTHWDEIKQFLSEIDVSAMVSKGAEVVTNFLSGVAESLPAIIEAGADAAVSFLDGIAINLDSIITAGASVISSLVSGVADNISQIIESATSIIVAIVETISTHLPEIVVAAVSIIAHLVVGIVKSLPSIITAAGQIITSLLSGIEQLLSSVISAGCNIVASVYTGIGQMLASLVNAGYEIISSVVKGIAESIGEMLTQGGKAVTEFMNGINDMIENVIQLGRDLVQGLIDGITGRLAGIRNAAVEMGQNLLSTLRNTLDIHSPSKESYEIAGDFMQGFLNSVKDNMSRVKDAVFDFGSTVLDSTNDSLTAIDYTAVNNEYGTYGSSISRALAGGLVSGSLDVYDALNEIAINIKQMITELIKSGSSQLYTSLNHIAANIKQIMSELVIAVQMQARRIISAAESALSAAASVGATSMSSVKVSKRAAGGTVPSGELFIANEAGPELVGKIGTTTATMNQSQIVDAVAAGVARAVQAAMSNSSSTNKVDVYLDGRQIYANQQQVKRNRGVQFNGGAFAR